MKVSVIIPTYKRPRTLLQTLASLQGQTRTDFELLVMDNAGEAGLAEVVGEFNRTAKVKARLIVHPTGGNSEARNRGAREASGDLLLYTDDDLTFCPGWVEAFREPFARHPEMVAAGGCVRPFWEKPPPRWLRDYMGKAHSFAILALMEPWPEFTLGEKTFFYSCNMAVRRQVFGWAAFHPEIIGTQTVGSGETGLQYEFRRRGLPVGYVPGAIAYHHIPPHRMTVQYIRRWAWHLGGCEMYESWRGRPRPWAALAREALGIARRHRRSWLKDFWVLYRRDREAIDTQFDASLGWCKLTYLWWMLTDGKVRAALDGPHVPPLRWDGANGPPGPAASEKGAARP